MRTDWFRGAMAVAGLSVLAVAALAPAASAQGPRSRCRCGVATSTRRCTTPWSSSSTRHIPTRSSSRSSRPRTSSRAWRLRRARANCPTCSTWTSSICPTSSTRACSSDHRTSEWLRPQGCPSSPGHVAVSTGDDSESLACVLRRCVVLVLEQDISTGRQALTPRRDRRRGRRSWTTPEPFAHWVVASSASTCRREPGANAYTYLPQDLSGGRRRHRLHDTSATMVSDPIVKEAFQYYKTMWDEGLMPEGAQAENGSTWQTTFASGNIGIQPLGGGWGIRGVKENNPSTSV